MDLTATYKTKVKKAGYFLPEVMIATGVASLTFVGVGMLLFFATHSMARLERYYEMERQARVAMHRLAMDVRAARFASLRNSNELELDFKTHTVIYLYRPTTQTLSRISSAEGAKVLLHGCESLDFSLYSPPFSGSEFDLFPETTVKAKLLAVNWSATRAAPKTGHVRRNVRTTKFVLRNK